MAGFRHQLVQTLEQLLKYDAVDHEAVKIGGLVLADVAEYLPLIVEREAVPGNAVLTDGTVAAAEPPLASGTGTAAVTVRLTEGVPDWVVELVVDLVADGNALFGGGIVDEMLSDLLLVFIG